MEQVGQIAWLGFYINIISYYSNLFQQKSLTAGSACPLNNP